MQAAWRKILLSGELSATLRLMAQTAKALEEHDRPLLKAIGRAVHTLRRDQGWSLDDLSKRTGLTPSALSRIERGANKEQDTTHLDKIAEAFGLRLWELMKMADDTAFAIGQKASSRSRQAHRRRSAGIQSPLVSAVN